MVVPINNSAAARARLQQVSGEQGAELQQAKAGAMRPPSPVSGADGVSLSEAASTQMGAKMVEQGPPFDLETVAKIKEAISEGRYPIDTQAIADSLFSGYTDMLL